MWGYESKKIGENSSENHVMMIGSILNEANSNSLVIGSGFVDSDRNFNGNPKFLTVRGNKTLDILRQRKFNYDISVGDPAILMPDYFKPIPEIQKYNLGVIPHLIDEEIAFKKFSGKRGVKIINLRLHEQEFTEIESIITQICSCRQIISSSLHGLIIAHTYGIPGIWCEFSDNVIGNGFKFKDYFSAHSENEDIFPLLDLKSSEDGDDPSLRSIKDLASTLLVKIEKEKEKMREIKDNAHSIISNRSLKYLI